MVVFLFISNALFIKSHEVTYKIFMKYIQRKCEYFNVHITLECMFYPQILEGYQTEFKMWFKLSRLFIK